MFPPLTAMAMAVVIQDYEDLEILKLLVRLAGNGRVHTSGGDSNVSKGKQNLVVQPTFHSSRSNAEMHPPEAAGGIQGPLRMMRSSTVF